MPANSLYTLTVGRSFLANFPALDETETGVIKAADVARAELTALREVQARLIEFYDVLSWEGAAVTPPPFIASIGEMLGSVVLWTMRNIADGGMAMTGAPEGLREYAVGLIDAIRAGRMTVIGVDGLPVQRLQRTDLGDIQTT